MSIKSAPIVTAQMLVRKPVEDVFEAFVDPFVAKNFLFTDSSGRLEAGKKLRWEWKMYGISMDVLVKEFDACKRILIEWGPPPTHVEWAFTSRIDGTVVRVSNWGFPGDEDQVINQAIAAKGGFSYVLAGLKAFLEHKVALNLVADHNPDGLKSRL